MRELAWFIVLPLLMLTTGCQTGVKAVVPDHFVEDKDVNDRGVVLGAIDPRGSLYRVRYVSPDEEGKFNFWRDALSQHLKDSGYIQLSEQEITVANRKGKQFEFDAPSDSESRTYQVSLLPHKDGLVVVEASADQERFKELKPNIDKAINQIQLK